MVFPSLNYTTDIKVYISLQFGIFNTYSLDNYTKEIRIKSKLENSLGLIFESEFITNLNLLIL